MATMMKTNPDEIGYQGWANYETWAVYTFLTKDELTYRFWQARAAHWKGQPSRSDVFTKPESARFNLADELKERHEEALDHRLGDTADLWYDLAAAALSEVLWADIADKLLAE